MEPHSRSDAELVAQTLTGQREPFGVLYDRYARLVASVTAGVAGDWDAVDDMVQECFLRAYRKLATLHDSTRFAAWIVGIARQVGRERRRTMRRDRHEFHDPITLTQNECADASAELCQREELDHIMQHVAALPENERIALHAFFLEEQNVNTTAEQLGMSRSGFYAIVQKAVAHLARQLAPGERERLKYK
jgi:RNA polymerase sigma factor (sigma-70 family)